MADETKVMFNQRAAEKLRNPEDLDKYVRVTNPGVWMVLLACSALLVGLLAWGVFGSVTTSVSTTGTSVDGRVICLLSADELARIDVGDVANVAGQTMTVSSIAKIPVSFGEAAEILKSDYLAATLMADEWAYPVEFYGDASKLDTGIPLAIYITTERFAPISLILGGNGR